jgi:hypothetical protein
MPKAFLIWLAWCGLVLASGQAGADEQARYQLTLDLKEDTYRNDHTLNFSRDYFQKLAFSANNFYSSKLVVREQDKMNNQQRSALSLKYAWNDRLNLSGDFSGSVNRDKLTTVNSDHYQLNAQYRPLDVLTLTQALGKIAETRMKKTDTGVQFNTRAGLVLPEKSGTSMSLSVGASGNNLTWGRHGIDAQGNVKKNYAPENFVSLTLINNWAENQDINMYSADQNIFTINSLSQKVAFSSDYAVSRQTLLGFSSAYSRDKLATTGNAGYARSNDRRGDGLDLGVNLKRGRWGGFDASGDLSYALGSDLYQDADRNERTRTYRAGLNLLCRQPRLDSLGLIGHYELHRLFDQDSVDDRDNLNLRVNLRYPVAIRPRLHGTLNGNVSLDKMVYVHPQKSINSQWTKIYKVAPSLVYRVAPAMDLSQTYLLSAQYVENIIKEIYDGYDRLRDMLYRTYAIDNAVRVRISPQGSLGLQYRYERVNNCYFRGGLFQSAFLRSTVSDKYNHAVTINYQYLPRPALSFTPQYSFVGSREKNRVTDDQTTAATHNLNMTVQYVPTAAMTMRLMFQHVFKTHLQGSEEQQKYLTFMLDTQLL